MKIALTGATGLVGSRVFDVLKNRYEIIPVSSSFNVDVTDRNRLMKFLSAKNPGVIVHLAAKTNVDACEEDKEYDLKKLKSLRLYKDGKINFENLKWEDFKNSKTAFGTNVLGTKNLADYAFDKNIKLIYISTDFVFDGEKGSQYSEEDLPAPVDWYGWTKYWGEEAISYSFKQNPTPIEPLVARIAFPYGYKSNIKKDLIWGLINLLEKNDAVKLVADQKITPTFIEDIVKAIDFFIENKTAGLFHLVGNNFLSPPQIGVAIAREFGLDESKIEHTTRADVYNGRAPRPFKVELKNDKLMSLGFEMTDFFDALKKIKNSS